MVIPNIIVLQDLQLYNNIQHNYANICRLRELNYTGLLGGPSTREWSRLGSGVYKTIINGKVYKYANTDRY